MRRTDDSGGGAYTIGKLCNDDVPVIAVILDTYNSILLCITLHSYTSIACLENLD